MFSLSYVRVPRWLDAPVAERPGQQTKRLLRESEYDPVGKLWMPGALLQDPVYDSFSKLI